MAGEFDEAGETVPNFTLYDLDGQAVDLYDFAEPGALLVVSLCAMWCGPCQSLAEDYDAIAAAYGDEFTYVELVLQDQFFQTADAADASLWASVYDLSAVNVLSVGGDSALAATISGGASLTAFPTYLVIDPATQTLVGSFTGYDGAENFIGRIEALAETATPVIVEGANGDDDITGGAAGDDLSGGRGDDTISGEAGDDLISGGRGADDLSGGAGDDTITGGRGADILRGGAGDDLLTGGRGADMFVFDLDAGVDVITDFRAGSDTILFDDPGFEGYEVTGAQDGDAAVVSANGVGAFDGVEFARITVENTDIADVLGFFG